MISGPVLAGLSAGWESEALLAPFLESQRETHSLALFSFTLFTVYRKRRRRLDPPRPVSKNRTRHAGGRSVYTLAVYITMPICFTLCCVASLSETTPSSQLSAVQGKSVGSR